MNTKLPGSVLAQIAVTLSMLLLSACNGATAASKEDYGPKNLIISHVKAGSFPYLWANTQFKTVRSYIEDENALEIPGIPEQPVDAPIAMLACSVRLSKPYGLPNNIDTEQFTVYNRTNHHILIASLYFVYRNSALIGPVIQHLAPHEVRSVTLQDAYGIGQIFGYTLRKSHIPKPTHILCGAGPAVADDGTLYKFHALFIRDP